MIFQNTKTTLKYTFFNGKYTHPSKKKFESTEQDDILK